MMSTFSGLVVGIVTAAVLTVFFGEELSHSLRSLLQRELAAVTLRLPPSQQASPGATATYDVYMPVFMTDTTDLQGINPPGPARS